MGLSGPLIFPNVLHDLFEIVLVDVALGSCLEWTSFQKGVFFEVCCLNRAAAESTMRQEKEWLQMLWVVMRGVWKMRFVDRKKNHGEIL